MEIDSCRNFVRPLFCILPSHCMPAKVQLGVGGASSSCSMQEDNMRLLQLPVPFIMPRKGFEPT